MSKLDTLQFSLPSIGAQQSWLASVSAAIVKKVGLKRVEFDHPFASMYRKDEIETITFLILNQLKTLGVELEVNIFGMVSKIKDGEIVDSKDKFKNISLGVTLDRIEMSEHAPYRETSIENKIWFMVPYLEYGIFSNVIDHYSFNDEGHRLTHIYPVMRLADRLSYDYPEGGVNKNTLLLGAFLHDVKIYEDRKFHHVLGAKYAVELVEKSYYLNGIVDPSLLSEIIYFHRASVPYTGDNELINIMRVADRGPISFKNIVKRWASTFPKHSVEDVEDTLDFITNSSIKKFGPDGYSWVSYPELGMNMFGEGIKDVKERLSGSFDEVKEMFRKELFNENK